MGVEVERHQHGLLLFFGRAFKGLLSVPMYGKVLGVGVLVSAVFGIITSYKINYELSSKQYDCLKDQSVMVGSLLSHELARPLAVDNISVAQKVLRSIMADTEEIEYIAVRDNDGKIIVKVASPNDDSSEFLSARVPDAIERSVIWRKSDDKIILESVTPILKGYFGTVSVGLSDTRIAAELRNVNWEFGKTWVVCMLAVQLLALLVTYFLTKPIHYLASTAEKLADGDFSSRATVFFDDEVGHLATTFNDMAANIEQNNNLLREKEQMRALLVKKLVSRGEEERRLIAQELHDELGQSLSLLLMQAQSMECDVVQQPCLHRIDFSEFLDRLIDDVRSMAFVLRPAELDDYGLDLALRRFVDVTKKRSNLSLDYQVVGADPKRRLAPEAAIMLYRIAQEAVSNIIRHSQAKNVSVILMYNGNNATLMVEDDGIGFDANSRKPGLGILGMRERASIIKGELLIESSTDVGTTIKIKVPINGEEQYEHHDSHSR